MPRILAINISTHKGTVKKEVGQAELKRGHGIIGDAHAGQWHRQVSLLPVESVRKLEGHGLNLHPGVFAENILTEGIELFKLPIGAILELGGDVLLQITQIGKECHHGCIIRQISGTCVMPTDGVFAKVLQGGVLKQEDPVKYTETSAVNRVS